MLKSHFRITFFKFISGNTIIFGWTRASPIFVLAGESIKAFTPQLMKFYILKTASGTEETGMEYPQAGMKPDYDFKALDSIWNVDSLSFPNFEPNLTYLDMVPGAKLSDFISTPVTHGFVVSPKVKDILSEFKLVPHKFHSAIVKHQGDFYNYFWLHTLSDLTDYIDFQKTKFFVDYFNKKENEFGVESKEDLKKMIKHYILQNRFIKTEQLFLSPRFYDLMLDLFIISGFDHRTYINETLRNRLLKQKVTGIEITEYLA